MRWSGGKKGTPPIAFIGKGVCFDTGGISIKPAASMEDMKGDMAGAACVVGLMQALTQIQEQTVSFVPKLIGVGLVLMLGGHWMLAELVGFTNHLFDMVPRLLQSA